MEKVTFNLPAMWADHHVLAVRQALGQVSGVGNIAASALYKDVQVEFDPATVTVGALQQALTEAGFAAQVPELSQHPKGIEDSSDWFQFQDRITVTDRRDLEMSGDFRKY